ncbi:hypothetical protein [Limosilactobacillus reuteri]|uniref:Uncharacterized protein n=1 Tax=Limosilactobacillus reuteri TaxID=1598 RepID=A0A0U5JT26_LIMRT|nr:hypothetical protein LRLP16767_LR3C6_01261 [Limosilactobacillus reuteri subsp. porcinus]
MTSRYDIAAIKKQLAAAEQHDKEIYGEKVRKMLLEKTNLDSLKDVLHDYDIVVVPKLRKPKSKEKPASLDQGEHEAEKTVSEQAAEKDPTDLAGTWEDDAADNNDEWLDDDE